MTMPMPDDSPASLSLDDLTPKQLAAGARVDLSTVLSWCRSGRIPAWRVGGRWRIRPSVLAIRDPDLWEAYVEGSSRAEEANRGNRGNGGNR